MRIQRRNTDEREYIYYRVQWNYVNRGKENTTNLDKSNYVTAKNFKCNIQAMEINKRKKGDN